MHSPSMSCPSRRSREPSCTRGSESAGALATGIGGIYGLASSSLSAMSGSKAEAKRAALKLGIRYGISRYDREFLYRYSLSEPFTAS